MTGIEPELRVGPVREVGPCCSHVNGNALLRVLTYMIRTSEIYVIRKTKCTTVS